MSKDEEKKPTAISAPPKSRVSLEITGPDPLVRQTIAQNIQKLLLTYLPRLGYRLGNMNSSKDGVVQVSFERIEAPANRVAFKLPSTYVTKQLPAKPPVKPPLFPPAK